jgi:hypothetical protein
MVSNYSGMTYEQASREAHRVLERYGWYQGWERLSEVARSRRTEADREGHRGNLRRGRGYTNADG